jgi:hypothetical protein
LLKLPSEEYVITSQLTGRAAMTPMRAEHCFSRIMIWQRKLADRRPAATLITTAKVFAQIGCEH